MCFSHSNQHIMANKSDLPPTCPRRSRKLSEVTIKKNKSSLEVLVQMGFPKSRAEKALAATGDSGVQLASDWLLSHVNDPTLDEHSPREYILYLCPVGQLQQELIDFWHRSFQECGWNRAHNYFPHVTLCSFFKAEDSQVPVLAHMLKATVDRFKKLPETIGLEYFSSTNFIGLFISDASSQFVKQLTGDFSEEAKKIGVTVEPHKKQLHISLAYQFSTDKKDVLETLAKTINPHLPVRWDIRLYSRENKLATCQVRKVLYSHIPTDMDELELVDGDYIFVESAEMESESSDGWYHGTSWLTGQTGMFPGPFTERCAESEVWTMHRAIPVVGAQPVKSPDANGITEEDEEEDNTPKPPEIPPRGASIVRTASHVGSKHSKPPAKSPTRQPQHQPQQPAQQPPQQPQQQPRQSAQQQSQRQSQQGAPKPAVASNNSHFEEREAKQSHGPAPAPSTCSRQQPPLPQMHPIHPQKLQQQQQQQQHHPQAEPVYAKVNKPAKGHAPPPPPPSATTKTPAPPPPQPAVVKTTPDNHGPKLVTSCSHNSMNSATSSDSPDVPPSVKRTSLVLDNRKSSVPGPGISAPITAATKADTLRGGGGTAHHQGPRQLYVIRHGERVDFTFGKEWIKNSFDKHGNYVRYDLNMPKKMPKRKGGPSDFTKDAPLTVQGHFQARLIGEAMKEKNITVSHIYSSPSLRCVETATSILKGLGKDLSVRIEPGLFEWLGWYHSGLPKYMTEQELESSGFSINRSHEVIWPFSKYNLQESTEQYYDRSHHVTKEILRRHDNEGGNVVMVAHAGSLDVCTRQLVGQPIRSTLGFHDVMGKCPYCAMSVAQEACLVRDTWYLIEPPILPFAHTNNPKYNWTCLTSPSLV